MAVGTKSLLAPAPIKDVKIEAAIKQIVAMQKLGNVFYLPTITASGDPFQPPFSARSSPRLFEENMIISIDIPMF